MTRRTTRTRTLLAAAAIAVVPLAGCSSEEPGETRAPTDDTSQSIEAEAPEDEGTPGVGEEGDGGAAAESIAGMLGEDVSFTGEVEDVLPPDAFTVGGDEIGEDPILVVGADLPAGFSDGDTVTIDGTVKTFVVQGYEDDLGLDLSDDEFVDFDGDPAVQASSVTVVEES